MAGSDLTEFLAQAGRRPFVWGSFDCLLYAADWARERSGVDPAVGLRGSYGDQRAARLIMLRAGGIAALVGKQLAPLGWRETQYPDRGDIGLAKVAYRNVGDKTIKVPAGAICVAPRMWAVKLGGREGIIVNDFPIMCAWTPAHG